MYICMYYINTQLSLNQSVCRHHVTPPLVIFSCENIYMNLLLYFPSLTQCVCNWSHQFSIYSIMLQYIIGFHLVFYSVSGIILQRLNIMFFVFLHLKLPFSAQPECFYVLVIIFYWDSSEAPEQHGFVCVFECVIIWSSVLTHFSHVFDCVLFQNNKFSPDHNVYFVVSFGVSIMKRPFCA